MFEAFEIGVAVVSAFYAVGVGLSLHAIMRARTSQGAIAWTLFLITLPYVAAPFYLIFGRVRFYGYVDARRKNRSVIFPLLNRLRIEAPPKQQNPGGRLRALEQLAALPATGGNDLKILRDGRESYPCMFDAIANAKKYILVQFYIVRDDHIGHQFADALIAKAQAGLDVYFLYDEIGCYNLSSKYIRKLSGGGVKIRAFHSTKGRSNRFQLNFRNHRKMVVADGEIAVIGGLNLGKEYNGEDPVYGFWRDTNVYINGPAVSCIQLSFVEDWHWATSAVPELFWEPKAIQSGQDVLILPSGPNDDLTTCSLFFCQSIHAAKERVWIATPYFVPDSSVISALQLAALRGVDVRVVVPANPDHKLVNLAAHFYIDKVHKVGVKVYRYGKGFMHHKVMLIDNRMSAIGSANLDNRSFQLNFEITMAIFGAEFAAEMQQMFDDDFRQCVKVDGDLSKRRLPFRMLVRAARLFSPIL